MTTKDRQLNMAINPCLHEQIYPNSKGEDFSRNQIQVISGTKYKLKEALKRNTSLKEPNAGYLSSKPNIAHFRKSFLLSSTIRIINNVRWFLESIYIAGHQAIESSYF